MHAACVKPVSEARVDRVWRDCAERTALYRVHRSHHYRKLGEGPLSVDLLKAVSFPDRDSLDLPPVSFLFSLFPFSSPLLSLSFSLALLPFSSLILPSPFLFSNFYFLPPHGLSFSSAPFNLMFSSFSLPHSPLPPILHSFSLFSFHSLFLFLLYFIPPTPISLSFFSCFLTSSLPFPLPSSFVFSPFLPLPLL